MRRSVHVRAWMSSISVRKEMFYLTTRSTHFNYGYVAREETRCRHMDYSFRLAARVISYRPSHRQDSTYHGPCYTRALAGTRTGSMGPPSRIDPTTHRTNYERTLLPRSYISLTHLRRRHLFICLFIYLFTLYVFNLCI